MQICKNMFYLWVVLLIRDNPHPIGIGLNMFFNLLTINTLTFKIMKKVLLTTVLMLFVSVLFSQDLTFKTKTSTGGGFDTESANVQLTTETISIDGNSYKLFATKSGSRFIKCVSAKTGKNYPVWIGAETTYTYEGRKVYKMKSGTFCVYKISEKSGNPYAVYLEAN